MIDIPLIGLGTWQLYGKACVNAVKEALDLGYCHIDTAFAYENHKAVGEGICGYDREKIFLTSKISLGIGEGPLSLAQVDINDIEGSVRYACDLALKEMGLEYLDLMMIHWPSVKLPVADILRALRGEVLRGKIRFYGCCNCTVHHLKDLYENGVDVDFNQVEFHPYLYQKELLEYGLVHGTRLIGYRPFGKGNLTKEDKRFEEIGSKYGKSANQVILRWLIQKGVPTLPKASKKEHLIENISVFDFELTKEDMDLLDCFNQRKRYCVNNWNEFDY